jgi:hypothetical protein
MFHGIVSVWTVLTRTGEVSGRPRRPSRRFVPQLGQSGLEIRLAPATYTGGTIPFISTTTTPTKPTTTTTTTVDATPTLPPSKMLLS